MNTNRKIQFTAAAVIANGALALGLLSSTPALAQACGPVEECTTASICSEKTKPCPPIVGCTYIGQSACSPPNNTGPCVGFYSYICYYAG